MIFTKNILDLMSLPVTELLLLLSVIILTLALVRIGSS